MTQEQYRLAIQNDVKNWLIGYKNTNGVPASFMEDAINKVLVSLKDEVLQEFIAAVSQPPAEEVPQQEGAASGN